MKKIDLAKYSRKLHKNHAFNFCDGEHIYPELFLRLNLIQKKEHSILCERLERTPEFKSFLQLDELDKSNLFSSFGGDEEYDNANADTFEQIKQAKQKSFTTNIFYEDIFDVFSDTVDVPVPLSQSNVLNAFNRVCISMQKDGLLNGVDLPSAVQMIKSFVAPLSLKAYEYATIIYGQQTKEALDFDINRYHGTDLSLLSEQDKAVLLSSAIYATICDFENIGDVEKCDNLQIQLTDTLFGLPECFFSLAVEKVNRNSVPYNRTPKDAVCENIRGFMGRRLKHFFSTEELTLSELVHVNKAIYQIENLSFDSLKSWNEQIRPLLTQICRYTPAYARGDFRYCVAEDLNTLSGIVAHADLSQQPWQQILFNHFSKCFSLSRAIHSADVAQKMNDLKDMANLAIYANPNWSFQEKDAYFDMVWSLKVNKPVKISKHQQKNNPDTGHTYE